MHGSSWTNDEIEFLQQNYYNNGANFCQKNIKRTVSAIWRKAKKLNLTTVNKRNFKWDARRDIALEVIKNSKSLSEVIIKFGLRTAGGNFETLKKFIKRHKISTIHFERVVLSYKKRPIEYYLVENNTSSSSSIKKRLFTEGFLENKCVECGQDEMWKGKKISLILDHKDGNHTNWLIENLRILCPNCNATLETHCRGQKGVEIKNKKAEAKKLFLKSKPVRKFNKNINLRRVVRPEYEILLSEISKTSYVATGKKYGVSDNSIRKWVKFYENELLSRYDLNIESSEPKSDVLPVTLRDSLVRQAGIEPANLYIFSVALYQLSYSRIKINDN